MTEGKMSLGQVRDMLWDEANNNKRYGRFDFQAMADAIDAHLAAREADAERLDWIESQAKSSYMYGVSFDHVSSVEGDPSGYRFLRRALITYPHRTLRQAIDDARSRA